MQDRIDALPTADQVSAMSDSEQDDVYTKLSDIWDAYYALPEADQATVEISALEALAEYFNGQTTALTTALTATQAVAKIGDTTYETLAEAVAAAQAGDTVTLLQDTSGSGIVIGSIDGQKNFTIDFNGCTYTVNSSPLAGSTGTETQCFQLLKATGSLTMKNGTIVADYSGVKMMIQNYCSLTLEDMTLDATTGSNNVGYVLSDNCGNTVITGSTTITAKSTGVAFDVFYWPSGGYTDGVSVTIDSADVTINGTVEYGSDGSADGKANVAEKAKLNILAGAVNGTISAYYLGSDGAAAILVSESATVSSYSGVVASVTTSTGTIDYATLQAAIDAAGTSASTVTLLQNTAEDITIEKGQTITLDLNGKTLTNSSGHTITNYGVLTVTDSSAALSGTVDNVTHSKGALVNYGTAYLNGGTFTRSAENGQSASNSGDNSWYAVKNYSQMTVDGAAIENSGKFSSCFANGYYNTSDKTSAEVITGTTTPTLTIKSGTVTGGLNSVKNDDCAVLTIEGGTFTNYSQCALQNHSIVAISGGSFTGGTYVLYNCGCDADTDQGVMTITGGTFTADENTEYILMMVSTADTASATIKGGTFDTNGYSTAAVFGANSTATEVLEGTIQVSGGSFSDIVPDAYCAVGYSPVTTTDASGMYTVCNHASSNVTAVEAKDATCTEDGNIAYWYCQVCGKYFEDKDLTAEITLANTVIDATGHTNVDHHAAVAADCTTPGSIEYWHCTDCGSYFSDKELTAEITLEDTVTAAVGHNWGEWETVESPSCQAEGSEQRVCSVCGVTETRGVEETGHDWETDYTIDQAATCTTPGSKSIHCKNCGVVKDSTVIPATGHDYDNPAFTWADDHSSAAAVFTCKNDSTHTETVTATVTSAVKTAATATEKGVTTYTATVTRNGVTYTDTVDVTDIPAAGTESTSSPAPATGSPSPAKNTVSTGDESSPILWAALLLCAAADLGVTAAVLGRKQKNR
ncbi:MAG: hypothetical protein LUG57_07635 [Oscillospiraceae bacterium]|nr:hypothetical protein [Oscillospiraceae bacterium]